MSVKRRIPIIQTILFFSLVVFTFSLFGQTEWKENSFEDFRDGWFLDGGSNLYVSANGRLQIITRWDINNDGFLDLLLPGGHGHTEKENTFIYLNNGKDIDGRTRIELPGGGSRDGLVADLNKDGYNDLAIANSSDSHFGRVNAWVYYGTGNGYTAERRIELPAYRGSSIAVGDFNHDTWPDLAIACQWQAGTITQPEGSPMSFIYWNSRDGFKPDNRLPLIFGEKGAQTFTAADLDGDGTDDLIALSGKKTYILMSGWKTVSKSSERLELPIAGTAVAVGEVNGDDRPDVAVCTKDAVQLFFGMDEGYSAKNMVSITVDTPVDVTLCDIDQDGFDDIIVANNATAGGAVWTDSYVFHSDGKDFSQKRIQKLPTLAATAVSAGDLNGDGFPELVFSNQYIANQLNIVSYVYWNDHGKLYFGNHTQLPTLGTLGNTIGDVNNDGLPDVIFFNEEGYFRDGPTTAYIYWGDGTRNYSEQRRVGFPAHHTFGHAHADLDDDGNVDLILSQERFMYRIPHEQNGLMLLWGDEGQFKDLSRLTMTTAYGGARIADIDRDGYLDILVGGAALDPENPDLHGIPIFWGSKEGYTNRNRTVIHHDIEKMRSPLLMDLNRDTWLDIAGQVKDGKIKIWWGSSSGFMDDRFTEIDLGREDHLMYITGADLNKDGWLDLLLPKRRPHEASNTSFIYYGSVDGFSKNNRIEVPSDIAYENSIADFDRDGWLDIFLTSYGTDLTGNHPSIIHWGGPEGFTQRPITELYTYGASASEAADYDGDGWLDVLVANHRRAGSTTEPIPHQHTTPSMLFWGGPGGFSNDCRWEVTVSGPSGLNVRDPGNSYDRGLYEDYVSSPFHIPGNQKPASISWQAETPFHTSVMFQIRTSQSEEGLDVSNWTGTDGEHSWYTQSGSAITGAKGEWIQYRARLVTPNGGPTPYLTEVVLKFLDN